ncbi:MAG: hypothetical protein UR25_C0001G0047 [Candidatus Nomurabacteria bacterium GW2011_GWE1_32_28]|uniref:Uncharacterized protein n=1 Tax=Candidatus Nomurabacteria bacterium GW2011_GWF1_31_48 TaxID=1618767 RepID=A0A0F9YEY6_9BACT|nr:MAG: hypothetical protein UR10_C0005G0001 [Candidatus Nomurabacteria bacterium GW2011_GWF2_30_133]KKP28353.1 MAG: hypothetical protein UR18_C0005G0001 [Candidatus Nomurabacteria bacterium GW2011_GWE2_31_40]KKP29938.1 MAG: hypothetical protein UR19_C0006G0001 [Candidatus Nomurabacteria bacterium GW2011_GWF1_31_48]KKP35135.1 MAG: hypothetical protein UR25_C0001G0047 [Candidatus Nomurabacteria bacterium GW2011_GWE1_32_28]HAS80947.1 hypothetical protein [Candidatus Nomurabacteria bacterium]
MEKKGKKIKTNLSKSIVYSSSEMKRYLGALSETHNEHLKGIKEGFIVVNRKIDNVTKTLNSHTEMIGVLMEDTAILKEDMQIVKKELKKKVDYDEFLSLVRRVQKIESKI